MLDDKLLESYKHNFFGYGNLKADYWFIGMEEGGGKSEVEIKNRIERWHDMGKLSVVDNYEFHRAVINSEGRSLSYLFDGKPSIQPTWGGLIRTYLSSTSLTLISAEDVRSVQKNNWGRSSSNNCLLELLPLPSPGTNKWNYDKWSTLNYLKARDAYLEKFASYRALMLRYLVRKYKPKSVIFYSVSSTYVKHWSRISGIDFTRVEPLVLAENNRGQTYYAKIKMIGKTLFVNSFHPVANGLPNIYFDNLGMEIRERIK